MYEVDSYNLGVTVGDADAKVCRPLAAKAVGWDDAVAKIKADGEQKEREKRQREEAEYVARKAEEEAPYRRVGIDGEKLRVVAGGCAYIAGMIPATPERAAHASVLFTLGNVTTGERLLVRYEFRGNKKVAETEQKFWTNPGPEFYR